MQRKDNATGKPPVPSTGADDCAPVAAEEAKSDRAGLPPQVGARWRPLASSRSRIRGLPTHFADVSSAAQRRRRGHSYSMCGSRCRVARRPMSASKTRIHRSECPNRALSRRRAVAYGTARLGAQRLSEQAECRRGCLRGDCWIDLHLEAGSEASEAQRHF